MDIIQGKQNPDPQQFYDSLKDKLDNYYDFPDEYLFKFIVPTDPSKITEIYQIFDGIKFTLSNRESKNGKYTACSINAFVLDSNQVVNIYQQVGKIEGVVLL